MRTHTQCLDPFVSVNTSSDPHVKCSLDSDGDRIPDHLVHDMGCMLRVAPHTYVCTYIPVRITCVYTTISNKIVCFRMQSLSGTTQRCQHKRAAWVSTCTGTSILACFIAKKYVMDLSSQPQWNIHAQWTPPHLLRSVGLKLVLVCMMYRGAPHYWMRLLVSDCVQCVGVQGVMSSVTWESCDHTGLAYRLCDQSGMWEEPDVRDCQSVAFRNIETTVSWQICQTLPACAL